MRQRQLRELLPGGAGGVALAVQRGGEYMAALSGAGGRTTRDRHGHAYMGALARRGAAARWASAGRPQTRVYEVGDLTWAERRVSYRRPGRRRAERVVIVLWETEHD